MLSSSVELAATRRRFVLDSQAGVRRPAVVAGTCLVFCLLGAAPLVPQGRALLGVPFIFTATWAGTYVALSVAMCIWFHRGGTTSRLYWLASGFETAIWMHGVAILGGLSGEVTSPWLVLSMLGYVALAGMTGLSDRPHVVVAAATPVVAGVAYAPLGAGIAIAAFLISSLGFVAFYIIASAVERFLDEQAHREDLQRKLASLERQQIARDLHDSVGSTFALVGLYSALIDQKANRPDDLRQLAAMLGETSRDGLDELRGLLEAIGPSEPTVGGLHRSIERLVTRFPDPGLVSIHVDAEADLPLDDLVRAALVRVFQEASSNAIRHGRPSKVAACVHSVGNQITLSIHDDGAGFDPDRTSDGRGLTGMRARASELGGELRVQSAPGGGTQLHFEVPRTHGASPAIHRRSP